MSKYAYLMEYHEYLTPRAVNKLLEKDVIIKVSTKPFEINGRKFDYGTILIPVLDNDPDKLFKIITEIGNDSHVRIHLSIQDMQNNLI